VDQTDWSEDKACPALRSGDGCVVAPLSHGWSSCASQTSACRRGACSSWSWHHVDRPTGTLKGIESHLQVGAGTEGGLASY
jgi:hypothetical protein